MKTDTETLRYQRDRIFDVALRVIKPEPEEKAPEIPSKPAPKPGSTGPRPGY